ncbi:hypothetical protein CA601_15245 [Paraburkholderia hospita]|nr:hypothetical protein CA601_15245 [Paraburkholderia hospita]OUL96514.1 hypothetical protein CA603_05225 [Paraburkholderia hospita]
MSSHLYTELMLRALGMALQQRRHDGVILHSDQGCQYTKEVPIMVKHRTPYPVEFRAQMEKK